MVLSIFILLQMCATYFSNQKHKCFYISLFNQCLRFGHDNSLSSCITPNNFSSLRAKQKTQRPNKNWKGVDLLPRYIAILIIIPRVPSRLSFTVILLGTEQMEKWITKEISLYLLTKPASALGLANPHTKYWNPALKKSAKVFLEIKQQGWNTRKIKSFLIKDALLKMCNVQIISWINRLVHW